MVFMPERRSLWCQTQKEAEQLKAQIERTIADQSVRSVGDTLAEYLGQLRRNGLKEASLSCIELRLLRFYRPSARWDRSPPALPPSFTATRRSA